MRTVTVSRRAALLGVAAAAWGPVRASGQRIVSIGGALTETLYALGAEKQLVGVDTTSMFPSAARALPSVGYARQLSAEGLLSLRPTLVVAGAEAGPATVLRQVEAARVPLQVLDAEHRYEGVLERTRRLAELSGRIEAGRALIAQMQRQWADTSEQLQQLKKQGAVAPKVLFILSHSMAQVRVAGRATAADAMIGYAGGQNVLAALDGFKPLSPEAAIAAAPEVLLVTDIGLEAAGGVDGLLRAPGLAQTPAGRARRVVVMDALLMLGFGPRLPQAVQLLAQGLHKKAA